MTSTLILIRALAPDPVSVRLAETLEAAFGRRPVFVCDETRGPKDTGIYDKVSLTPDVLEKLGITYLPKNWGWFWGDMCYYAAQAAFPGFDRYLLVESDVYFSATAADDFMRLLAESDHDVLARRLGRAAEPQKYSRALAPLGLDPHWGCIFPATCVRAHVIPKMLDLRKEAMSHGVAAQLNDEAILAGTVARHDLAHAALETLAPTLFDPRGFDTNPPHLFEAVAADPKDPQAYHPVVSFEKVMARIADGEKNYTKHRLRKVLKAAPKPMRTAIRAALIEAEE